jgi:hypothetical protein
MVTPPAMIFNPKAILSSKNQMKLNKKMSYLPKLLFLAGQWQPRFELESILFMLDSPKAIGV